MTSDADGNGRRRRLLWLLLVLSVAAALRLAPIRHGLPRNYVPDTHVVRAALGMARDKNPVPPAGAYSTYPNLLPYTLLPIYAGRFALGLAAGEWEGVEGFGDHLLEHPEDAHLLARVMVALFGVLGVFAAYGAARAAGLTSGALVSAWLVGTSLLVVQLSTHERPWVPLTTFISFAAWGAIRAGRDGSTRALLASCAAAALAFATHQTGVLALGLPVFAWFLAPLGWKAGDLRRRLLQAAAGLGLFALLSLSLGHPYLLVHGRAEAQALAGGAESVQESDLSLGGQPVRFGFELSSFRRLSRVSFGYDPVLCLLGLAGLLLALRERRARAALVWTLCWGGFFLFHENDHVRYLTPALVGLALPAGFVAERLATCCTLGRVALGLLLALPLVPATRLAWVLRQADTRAQAEESLFALPLGARVALDRYAPTVDLSLDALERLERVRAARGDVLTARERHRKWLLGEGLLEKVGYGLDAVPLADYADFDERSGEVHVRAGLERFGADLSSVLEKSGATHLVTSQRAGMPAFFDGLLSEGAELARFDPGGEGRLPTEMEFPWSSLWSTRRPGPRVIVYALE